MHREFVKPSWSIHYRLHPYFEHNTRTGLKLGNGDNPGAWRGTLHDPDESGSNELDNTPQQEVVEPDADGLVPHSFYQAATPNA